MVALDKDRAQAKVSHHLKKYALKRFPIVTWLPRYNTTDAICDAVAGFTVGLTVIPQGIAYAVVAGLEPQYGLYAAFMGCFVYIIFGGCKDITIGPTAILALMTSEYTVGLSPDFAILLCFLSGLIMLLMGILQLGFLVDFISVPVTAGFTSAAAITIASSQVKDLFGITIHAEGFVNTWKEIFLHISEARLWDSVLGLSCVVILLILRKTKDIKIIKKSDEKPSTCMKVLDKTNWLISTARNAIIVVLCAIMASLVSPDDEEAPFRVTGHVEGGLPRFSLPEFSHTYFSNETNATTTIDFFGMVNQLGPSVITIPLIALIETIAIAKAFAGGKSVDATQEMIAVGLCNVFGSFVQSFPVTGSFSRTAVNNASGVKTPMGGLYTGALVLLALGVLTPYFRFIPKATLAAVIITAVIFMIEYHIIMPIWRTSKLDLIPGFFSFICCLFVGLEIGILVGVAVNILFLLFVAARPKLKVRSTTNLDGSDFLLITPDRYLTFPSSQFICDSISKAGLKQGKSVAMVIVDFQHVLFVDFTTIKSLKALVTDYNKRSQTIVFTNVNEEVNMAFEKSDLQQYIYNPNDPEKHKLLEGGISHL